MANFQMVKYHARNYPLDIPLYLAEIAAHFDVIAIGCYTPYSLHTEYSYGKRALDSTLLSTFPTIVGAAKNGVPQLWKSEKWALEFARFLTTLSKNKPAPSVIEIHPPFGDYATMDDFISYYLTFEASITQTFPDVELLIENRCGSTYRGGKFILSKANDLQELTMAIQSNHLRLKLALDIPQLFTAHNVTNRNADQYTNLLAVVKEVRNFIGGVHLWGKRKSASGRRVAHCGDLSSYFDSSEVVKQRFLQSFAESFDDKIERKLVLEVNSGNEDMLSIIRDLQSVNVSFV